MENLNIGVLGGMGTYATIHLFKQYAEIFPAEKEWDRPRIVIDHRCTMPSRVRAFLYDEDVDKLVNEMSDSMRCLSEAGCNRIILACNTSHLFLPQIYQKVPEIESKVVNIIHTCVEKISEDDIRQVYLLGSEGTIESGIYQNALEKRGIKCVVPERNEYGLLRECIEAVKQNKYTDIVEENFLMLLEGHNNCILGCTELPIMYAKYREHISSKNIYDPLLLGLKKIRSEYVCD